MTLLGLGLTNVGEMHTQLDSKVTDVGEMALNGITNPTKGLIRWSPVGGKVEA